MPRHTTRRSRLALALIVCSLVCVSSAAPAGAAGAGQLPPRGPWPAPVNAGNPIAGTRYADNGGYATSDADLRAWFALGHRHYTTISRPAGYTVLVEGSLHGLPSHHPINGAELVVVEQTAAAPSWSVVAYARTQSNGHYRVRLPPAASRRVAVLYWATIAAPAPVYSRRLDDRTTTLVRLVTRVHHTSVHFAGVVGGGLPPGLLVAIQVRNELGAWVTATFAHTDANGLFRTAYHFEPGSYVVRAYVPEQPSLPYYPGASYERRVSPF